MSHMPAYRLLHNNSAKLTVFALSSFSLGLAAQTTNPSPLSQESPVELAEIIITSSNTALKKPWGQSPSGAGEVVVVDAKEIASKPAARIEEVLQDAGIASGDAGSSLGLTPSIGLRGFSVNSQAGTPSLLPSNILLNGHADTANGFTRDMSTVERIEVMGGFDSTIVGAGTPSGVVQYQSKRPQGKDSTRVDASFASDGLKRLVLDTEKKFEAWQVRLVAATQSGQKTVEGQPTDRDNVLLSALLPTSKGAFRIDVEHQNNRAPYVFGTAYTGGQFWYDKPYVSPQNQSSRQADRVALYYDHRLGDDTFIKGWLQQSHVNQSATLVGFWNIKNADTLNGYYRLRSSSYQQQDFGFSVDHSRRLGGLSHSFTVLAQQQQQKLDFNGPQSISQYTISVQNPIWPIDLSILTLKPRTLNEQYLERGLAIADAIDFTDRLQLRIGTRFSGVHIDTANNTPILKPTADMHYATNSEGLSYQISKENKVWLSRANSFAPVRGQTKDGGFLPPTTATQWELGIKRQTNDHLLIASLFNIQQNNLPAVDPTDKNYLIPLGGIKSQGLTLSEKTSWLGLQLQANATFQNVAVSTPVSSTQGLIVAGVPRTLGALKLSTPEKQQGVEGWARAVGSGKKSADAYGAVYAAGYVRYDAGLAYKEDKWQAAAWVQNLTDLRYIQALNAVDNVWQGARRSVWVNLSYKY